MNIPVLSNSIKGILLIVGGTLLLLHILGITTELMHSIILFGSIGMIILGFFMANLHKRILSLIRKNEPPQNQNNNSSTDDHHNEQHN